ncbi:hypothetical protein LTS18_008772, partial [Coniosporium uncinatum]
NMSSIAATTSELRTARFKHYAALALLERILGASLPSAALVPPLHEPSTPHTRAQQIDLWVAEDTKRADQIRFVVETRYQHALLQRLQDEGVGKEMLERVRDTGQKAGRKYRVGRRFGTAVKDERFMKVIRGGGKSEGDAEGQSNRIADGNTPLSAAALTSPPSSGKRKREGIAEEHASSSALPRNDSVDDKASREDPPQKRTKASPTEQVQQLKRNTVGHRRRILEESPEKPTYRPQERVPELWNANQARKKPEDPDGSRKDLFHSSRCVYGYRNMSSHVEDGAQITQRGKHEANEKQDASSAPSNIRRRGRGQFAWDVSHEEVMQRYIAHRSANPSPEEHGNGATSENVDTSAASALGSEVVRKRGRGAFAWKASEDAAMDESLIVPTAAEGVDASDKLSAKVASHDTSRDVVSSYLSEQFESVATAQEDVRSCSPGPSKTGEGEGHQMVPMQEEEARSNTGGDRDEDGESVASDESDETVIIVERS